MAAQPVKQYGTELEYGLGEEQKFVEVGGRSILAQSAGVSDDTEVKEYKNNAGQTCTLVVPERRQSVNIEGLMRKGETDDAPEKGAEVTGVTGLGVNGLLAGVTWRLDSFSVNWSNEDVAKVSMTVKSYWF